MPCLFPKMYKVERRDCNKMSAKVKREGESSIST